MRTRPLNPVTTDIVLTEQAGVSYVFVNLGSDHPSILEAMVKGQNEKKEQFPTIITCPNEVLHPILISIVAFLCPENKHLGYYRSSPALLC